MTIDTRAGVFTILVILLLAGCLNLNPSVPSTRYYVLDGGTLDGGAALDQRLDGVSIGLKKLQIAPYLESVRMVVRNGTHRVSFSEFDRWGEDLAQGINRTVANRIAARLPARRVEAAPWSSGTRHDYVIQVRVLRFEGVTPHPDTPAGSTDGAVHLLAEWEVLDDVGQELRAAGTTDYRRDGWRVNDHAQLVSLLNEALQALSEDLVAGILASPAPLHTRP